MQATLLKDNVLICPNGLGLGGSSSGVFFINASKLFNDASASRYDKRIFPISWRGPNTKKEKICMVTNWPASMVPLKISCINMKRITWRKVFTIVPWIKLMLLILFTFVSYSLLSGKKQGSYSSGWKS